MDAILALNNRTNRVWSTTFDELAFKYWWCSIHQFSDTPQKPIPTSSMPITWRSCIVTPYSLPAMTEESLNSKLTNDPKMDETVQSFIPRQLPLHHNQYPLNSVNISQSSNPLKPVTLSPPSDLVNSEFLRTTGDFKHIFLFTHLWDSESTFWFTELGDPESIFWSTVSMMISQFSHSPSNSLISGTMSQSSNSPRFLLIRRLLLYWVWRL